MLKNPLATAALLLCCASPHALAADVPPEAVSKMLREIIPGQTPDNVRAVPIGGFYEVTYGGETFYISSDGQFMLQGDLYDLKARVNLTEVKRAQYRRTIMQAVNEKDAIIFSPKDEAKHTVYVFTDIDCGYCRQLHKEIGHYNDLGIEIRYLAYPRSGVDTPSYHKAVSVWCAEDRKAAMTEAKAGRQPPQRKCENPVESEMALGKRIGVSGTPTLVFDDGSVVPGYLSPVQLAHYLQSQFAN